MFLLVCDRDVVLWSDTNKVCLVQRMPFGYLRLVTVYTVGLTLQPINKHKENSFRCKISRLLLLVDLVNDAELLSWVPAERTGR